MPPTLDDYAWLVSDAAARWHAYVAEPSESLVQLATALRKELTQARAHLVMEQAELRQRGRKKFPDAQRLFFTRDGLEQASSEAIARYKASRLPADTARVDLCCGIGGDLLAMAETAHCTGIDMDPVCTLLAQANAAARNCAAKLVCEVVDERTELPPEVVWHIDPQRRRDDRRTTRLHLFAPPLSTLERLLGRCHHAAIKLAPASKVPDTWRSEAAREWISHQGECKQQIAWFGKLARWQDHHVATLVTDAGSVQTFRGEPGVALEIAQQVGQFLFEPDASVLAAQLTGALAHGLELKAIASRVPYLTGDQELDHPLLSRFRVLAVLPWSRRRVRQLLRERGIGPLEVKKRGVDLDPLALQRELQRAEGGAATLLLAPTSQNRITAILATRSGSER